MENEISQQEKAQAELMFKVLLKKNYKVPSIAAILGHCGKMLLEYATQEERKIKVVN